MGKWAETEITTRIVKIGRSADCSICKLTVALDSASLPRLFQGIGVYFRLVSRHLVLTSRTIELLLR